jgi:hypothetical protein
MRIYITAITAALVLAISGTAQAFCGFYVAKADTRLFNNASQVVLVRDGHRTVITMSNDFQGDVKDFAMVIPVPTFIQREQINIGERSLIDHLDAYTAPRLVEYHDPDPCVWYDAENRTLRNALPASASQQDMAAARERGVTIEATYTVGEYDIMILSADQSDGLIQWLTENGYRIPPGAEPVVGSYLKRNMRFFVARVNLEEQARLGFTSLRPLQIAYESNRFMLPIRLGTLNAKDQQELFVYALTRTGRVETTNYRTVKLPSDAEVPEFVEEKFSDFYRALFTAQTIREQERAVFLEYAWDMAWCDPCAADPLSPQQLRQLGVFWLDSEQDGARMQPQAQDVFVTRLHVRYDKDHFPEDLTFHETGDRQNYQGRYVIRHPFRGQASCNVDQYRKSVRERQEREAHALATLTGWDIDEVRAQIDFFEVDSQEPEPWWKKLWRSD